MVGAPWVGLAVVGTWFIVTMVAAGVAVWALTPWTLARVTTLPPARRAMALLLWRLLPSGLAIWTAALLVAPTFMRHEAAGSTESVPGWMAMLSAIALATLVWRGLSGARAVAAVSRHLRTMTQRPDYPDAGRGHDDVVEGETRTAFVAGLLAPRIVVSRALAASLSRCELDAVVAHERAHIAARDNLKRLAMLMAPDWLGLTRRGRRIERAWVQAAELAADDAVAGRGARAAVDLASALVKAARIDTAGGLRLDAVSGMVDGDEVATRVTRLVTPTASPATRTALPNAAITIAAVAALALTLILQVTPLAETLHAVSEWAINR